MEEIQNVLTDVMFINRGRIVFECSMEELESRYLEVMVNPEQLRRRGHSSRCTSGRVFGRSILLFDESLTSSANNWPRLAKCARPASRTCSWRCWRPLGQLAAQIVNFEGAPR